MAGGDDSMDFETEIVALKETVQAQSLLLDELRAALKRSVPIGTIVPFSGKQDPLSLPWFLPADGSVVPPDERYKQLRETLGDAFRRADDPPGTCRLPDLRGRAPVGSGRGPGLSERTLGQAIGAETHTLTVSEMPAHRHGTVTGVDTVDHTHIYRAVDGRIEMCPWFGVAGPELPDDPTLYGIRQPSFPSEHTAGVSTRHQHEITSEGGGAAHENMQPSLVVRYLVKAVE
jgi:microcystin-dependent protein